MSTVLSEVLANAMAEQLGVLLDAGTDPGYIEIRSGTQPADPETAATGTLLAKVVLESPPFDTPAGGVADLFDPDSVDGLDDGTASWCRFYDGDDNPILDGEVTLTAGGGLVRLSSLAITTGNPVDITGGTWTQPKE